MATKLYKKSDTDREPAYSQYAAGHPEKARSAFRQDYGRLIHSSAFRRLAGKKQLFPAIESDFFRNRLTHSFEVAQIAKAIALRLNRHEPTFRRSPIDTDLVETAALAHDLGHPPFGHNGEDALDWCMRSYGGFEGNAQTLRILARLEKKVAEYDDSDGITSSGVDRRLGLNLTYRTLAAVLKYDNKIPVRRPKPSYRGPIKGYYASEHALVETIRAAVAPNKGSREKFKTLECHIMDLADDIAYSTYDLEDAFKAGFLTPAAMFSARNDLLDAVAKEVSSKNPDIEALQVDGETVRGVLIAAFRDLFDGNNLAALQTAASEDIETVSVTEFTKLFQASNDLAENGYLRTRFTSNRVASFLFGVRFEENESVPALSRVYFQPETLLVVEVLKRFSYIALINSARLKVAEIRGKEIVTEIFETLVKEGGAALLPEDYQRWYKAGQTKADKYRTVCDFVAGMTDRYAVEFWGRIRSESPQTIFKPI